MLAACTPATEAPPSYEPPSGVTRASYAPNVRLDTFPDLFHSQPDAATATGLRVHLGDAARTQLHGVLPAGYDIVEALEELDGFGTTAGVSLSFTAAVDPASFASSLRFVRLHDGADVPVAISWTDQGMTAILEPMFPLEPATAHAVIETRDLVDAEGGAVWRSVDLDAAMTGNLEGAPAILGETWTEALEVTGLERDDVSAGVVFVTQSIGAQDEAVRQFLLAAHPTLARVGECAPWGDTLRCEATLTCTDVLGADGFIGADETPTFFGTYELPITIWLPGAGLSGPYPTVIYGHGLGGQRHEAHRDADPLAAIGVAVVAADAPFHGDHPGAPEGGVAQVLEFFGVSGVDRSMKARSLRDNLRLGAWEKLQLAAALRAGFDANGDGHLDFEPTRMGYSGVSLGGVMGVQALAQDPNLSTAYLIVPGGGVSAILQRSGTFAPLVGLLQPPGMLPGDMDRFFLLLQTAVERADPLNWASQVLDGHRDVLVQEVIDDDIMPNAATRSLARALHVQLVGPELQEVAGLEVHPDPMPVSGNAAGHTAVLYQYDDMVDGGALVKATHLGIYGSDSNRLQSAHWFRTWVDGGLSEAMDPFGLP